MAKTSVVFYQEDPNNVPVLKWLDRLPLRVQDKCRVRIERLRDLGHDLRRPEACLRDGTFDLRVGFTGMNYRILYFFYGQIAAVLSHGLLRSVRCRRVTLRKRSDVSVGLKPIQSGIPIKEHDESQEKTQTHERRRRGSPSSLLCG